MVEPRFTPAFEQFVPKVQVTLRLDAHIIAHYRATGPRWQTRINADLAQVVRVREQLAEHKRPASALRLASKSRGRAR